MTTLQSTKFTLDIYWAENETAAYFDNGDIGSARMSLRVPKDVWEDMGAPATITVTIEPGDRLNG